MDITNFSLTNKYGAVLVTCERHYAEQSKHFYGSLDMDSRADTDKPCKLCTQERQQAEHPAKVREALLSPKLSHTRARQWCGQWIVSIYHREPSSPSGVLRAEGAQHGAVRYHLRRVTRGWTDQQHEKPALANGDAVRDSKRIDSEPIHAETAERLYAALSERYPGKVWRVIEVCPVAVVKTIDNEADALTTIGNLERAKARDAEEAIHQFVSDAELGNAGAGSR